MLRHWIAIGLVLICVGSLALAQGAKVGGEARQIAMGASTAQLGVAVNPFITQDPVYILVNPAYQLNYGSYVWWNIGGGTLCNVSTNDNGYQKQNVGVSFNVTRDLVIGGVFSYDPSAVNVVATMLKGGAALAPLPFSFPGFVPAASRGGGVTGGQTIPPVQNVWEILGAYNLGKLDVGFGFMYGSSNSDASTSGANTSSEREASSSMLGFRGGLLFDLGDGSMIDAHAALRLDRATDNVKFSPVVASQGGEYSASGTEIDVAARLRLHVSSRFSFVPYGSFTHISAEPKEDAPRNTVAPTTASQSFSTTALAVGAGGEYKTSTFFLAGGLSYQMLSGTFESSTGGANSSSTKTTVSYTAIPTINIGAEWWFLDWLAARGGYFRSLGSIKTKIESSPAAPATGTTSETNVTTPISLIGIGGLGGNWDGVVTLGVGLRFGNFSLDATVSDEALRRGAGLLGSGDNINTFGYLTANYNFE
jgi:hypothetical protein